MLSDTPSGKKPESSLPTKVRALQLGRKSIFRGKGQESDPGAGIPKTRVNGVLSRIGATAFTLARQRLRQLFREVVGRQPSSVSDGDTIEALARGWDDTRAYLERIRAQEDAERSYSGHRHAKIGPRQAKQGADQAPAAAPTARTDR